MKPISLFGKHMIWRAKRTVSIALIGLLLVTQSTPAHGAQHAAQDGGDVITCLVYNQTASVYATNRISGSRRIDCSAPVNMDLEIELYKWTGASYQRIESHLPYCVAVLTCRAFIDGAYGSGDFYVRSSGWIIFPPGYEPSPQQIETQTTYLTVSGGPGSPAP